MKRQKMLRHSMLMAAVLLTVAGNSYAAIDAGTTEQVVVTASKTKELVKNAPAAVEVITNEDIKRLGADSVLQALATADNVNVTAVGMTGNQIMIRGMETRHTLVLVDGRRVAGEDAANTTNVYTLSRMPIDNVERIEIVRGSASALYGSDAMGGVINIITKEPSKESFTVGATTGTKHQTNYYRYNSGKQGRWSADFGVNFTKERPINYYEYSYSPSSRGTTITDGYSRTMFGNKKFADMSLVYDFENTNSNKIKFDANYFKEDLKTETPDVKMVSPAMPGRPASFLYLNKNHREYYKNDGYGLGLRYEGKTQKNEYDLNVYYSSLDKDYRLYDERILPLPMERLLGGVYPKYDYDIAKYRQFSVEAKNSLFLNDKHTLTFGSEFRHSEYTGTRVGSKSTETMKVPEKHSISYKSIYVEDTWQANPKLLIIPALRYEHNRQFGSNLTPRLGATYFVDEHTRVKFNYGLGYKAPTISELYLNMFHTTPRGIVHVIGNPNLKSEKSRNFDIAIEAERGKWSTKASLYHSKVTNLIDAESLPVTPPILQRARYINVKEATIKGAEVSLGYNFNANWSIKGSYNYIDARNSETNTRLGNRPEAIMRLQLMYNDHKPNGYSAILWNEFSHNYVTVGRNDAVNGKYTYNLLNFSLNKKWTNGLSAFVGVDNILNRKEHNLFIVGRQWRAGVEWKM